MNNRDPTSTVWPSPKFHFLVNFGTQGRAGSFMEVSGLEAETQSIEYRAGNSPLFTTIKMPGLMKSNNVILKRGTVDMSKGVWDWLENIKMNTIKREQVTIQLMDENGSSVFVWTLQNAWPAKITLSDQAPSENEIAIEKLELAHEGVTVSEGQ